MDDGLLSQMNSALEADLRQAVERHAELGDVYAFAAQLDPEKGSITLAVADEAGIDRALRERYPDVVPPWEEGLWGMRWNPSNFPHQHRPVRTNGLLDSLGPALDEAVTGAVLEVLFEAIESADFGGLDTTSSFVAFATAVGHDEPGKKRSMRRTIAEPDFARLFPNVVAFERFVAEQESLPAVEQARFWADSMEQIALQQPTPEARTLRRMGRSIYDAVDALVALGAPARAQLMRLIERWARSPQFTEEGSEERARLGANTASSQLTTSALGALAEIGELSRAELDALVRLLHDLVGAYPVDGQVGITAAVVARVLHRSQPSRFGEPVVADDNRLVNHDTY